MPFLFSVFAFFVLSAAPLLALSDDISSRMENAEGVRSFYRVDPEYLGKPSLGGVKVAILAPGFQGIAESGSGAESSGRYLPKSAELVASYPGTTSPPPNPGDDSGRRMAQVIWGMTGFSEEGPHFRLYNANGLANFRRAVEAAIEWHSDIIVSNVNYAGFGNFDGTGMIASLLEKASRAKILWVQSAGEYQRKVYDGPIVEGTYEEGQKNPGSWLRFKGNSTWYLSFLVNSDDTDVQIALSWNAFNPKPPYVGTDKDLDLFLRKPDGEGVSTRIASSEMKQVLGTPTGDNQTNIPMETIATVLDANPQPYLLEIKHAGGILDPRRDRLRVTVTTRRKPFVDAAQKKTVLPIDFLDGQTEHTIPVPADSRYAFTIGDGGPYSSRGTTLDGRKKPDVIFDRSAVTFSDKVEMGGPDMATAQFAGIVTLMRAKEPELRPRQLKTLIAEGRLDGDKNATAVSQTSARWLTPPSTKLGEVLNNPLGFLTTSPMKRYVGTYSSYPCNVNLVAVGRSRLRLEMNCSEQPGTSDFLCDLSTSHCRQTARSNPAWCANAELTLMQEGMFEWNIRCHGDRRLMSRIQ